MIYEKEEKVRGEQEEIRWKKETIIHSKKEQSLMDFILYRMLLAKVVLELLMPAGMNCLV